MLLPAEVRKTRSTEDVSQRKNTASASSQQAAPDQPRTPPYWMDSDGYVYSQDTTNSPTRWLGSFGNCFHASYSYIHGLNSGIFTISIYRATIYLHTRIISYLSYLQYKNRCRNIVCIYILCTSGMFSCVTP